MWIPPSNFRAAGSPLFGVKVMDEAPAYIQKARAKHRATRAQKAGMAFEKAVHEHMGRMHGDCYIPDVWFSFKAQGESKFRAVEADGLHIDLTAGIVNILEVKIRHSQRAWWQLRTLYQPIVQCIFPHFSIQVVEVCKWFDVGVKLPEKPVMVRDALEDTDEYKIIKLQGVG